MILGSDWHLHQAAILPRRLLQPRLFRASQQKRSLQAEAVTGDLIHGPLQQLTPPQRPTQTAEVSTVGTSEAASPSKHNSKMILSAVFPLEGPRNPQNSLMTLLDLVRLLPTLILRPATNRRNKKQSIFWTFSNIQKAIYILLSVFHVVWDAMNNNFLCLRILSSSCFNNSEGGCQKVM